jgi:hypothetical protein
MFEKALDTASKSPYATWGNVESWLLVGMGNGARVATTISSKAKAPVAGLAVISYPLHEATPPAGKGAGFPDSTTQLIKCTVPLLVLHAERDGRCAAASMRSFCQQQRPQQPGPCFGVIPGVNEHLLGSNGDILRARTMVWSPELVGLKPGCPKRRRQTNDVHLLLGSWVGHMPLRRGVLQSQCVCRFAKRWSTLRKPCWQAPQATSGWARFLRRMMITTCCLRLHRAAPLSWGSSWIPLQWLQNWSTHTRLPLRPQLTL